MALIVVSVEMLEEKKQSFAVSYKLVFYLDYDTKLIY